MILLPIEYAIFGKTKIKTNIKLKLKRGTSRESLCLLNLNVDDSTGFNKS